MPKTLKKLIEASYSERRSSHVSTVPITSPVPVADLAQAWRACPYLSGEWSLKLSPSDWTVRDKYICWLNNSNARARVWLDTARALLPRESLIGRFAPSEILNLGLGIGCADPPIYIHGRIDGKTLYLADAAGYRREYRFYHFPFTTERIPPDRFVPEGMLPLFQTLKQDAILQALSGFWLRYQHRRVDQVSLSFLERPPLAAFLAALAQFSSASLEDWKEHHVKHIAFNASGDLTLYFSGKISRFPTDLQMIQNMVKVGARQTNSTVTTYLEHCTFSLPRFLEDCQIADPSSQENEVSYVARMNVSDIVTRLRVGGSDQRVCMIGRNPGEMKSLAHRLNGVGERLLYVTHESGYRDLAAGRYSVRLFDSENSLPAGFFDAAVVMEDTTMSPRLMANLKPFCSAIYPACSR